MGIKILLSRWENFNFPGGDTTRYTYLKEMFPDVELVSYENIFKKRPINYGINAIEMSTYYKLKYIYNKNILIIRNPTVGVDSEVPQITVWGNPFKSITETINYNKKFYTDMTKLQTHSKNTFKVAVSNFMAEDMKKLGIKPDKIIPNCVDIKFFKPLNNKNELRKKYKIPINKKVGIFVGINSPIKNIKMIEKLIKKFTDIFWIIVSKDNPNMNYTNLISLATNNRESLSKLYNCADFYILTSPIEGCSHTILEAMACNIPCITSQTGYFWDFWDKRIGYRTEWNNFDSYVKAIKRITTRAFNPRQVIIDRKLDLESWKKEWYKIIEEVSKK